MFITLIKVTFIFFLIFRVFDCFAQIRSIPSIVTPKKVFAHYMVCCPTRGGSADVNDFKKEIIAAQNRGLDGFVLNVGGWDKSEPSYKKRVLQIYYAAKILGTNFNLFLSADGKALAEIDDMITTLKDHPNQFKYNGKLVVSTFSGGTEGDPITKKAHELGAFIIPYYYPLPVTELPQLQHVKFIENTYPDIDGFFYFGAAGSPDQIANSISLMSREFSILGKVFMAGITPYYKGNGSNFRVYETYGFEGMAKEWQTVIDNNVPWVELVTWNDWNESTYLAPLDNGDSPQIWNTHFGKLFLPHNAYLDASTYFIKWFKCGAPPKITSDSIYYFYRLHKKDTIVTVNAVNNNAGSGLPNGAENLQDKVFVTTMLTKPAQLIIRSGSKVSLFELNAGVQHVSIPFDLGSQEFKLIRNSTVLIDKIGEYSIENDPASRFNYFSGQAENVEDTQNDKKLIKFCSI